MAEAVAHTSGDEFAFELDDQPGSFIPLLKAIKDGRASKPGGPWDYDVSPNGLKIALWSTDPAASGAVLVVDDSGDDTSHAGLTPVRAVLPEGWNGWNADNTPDWDTSFVFPSEVERPLNLWHKHASTSGADGWFALVASERSFVFAAHNDQNGSHLVHFFGDLLPVANGGGATPALHGLSSQDDYSQSFDRAFRARNGAIGVAHRDETWGIGALWSPGSSSSFVMRTAMWAGVNDNQWPDALGFITSGAATYPFPHLAAPLGALLHPYHVVAETAAGVQIAGTIPGVEVIMHDRPFGARQIVGNTGASGVVDSVSLPLDYYDGAAVEGQILVNLGGDWYAD